MGLSLTESVALELRRRSDRRSCQHIPVCGRIPSEGQETDSRSRQHRDRGRERRERRGEGKIEDDAGMDGIKVLAIDVIESP